MENILIFVLGALFLIVLTLIVLIATMHLWEMLDNKATEAPKDWYLKLLYPLYPTTRKALVWRGLQRLTGRGHSEKPSRAVKRFRERYPHIFPGNFVKLKTGTRYTLAYPDSFIFIKKIFIAERLSIKEHAVIRGHQTDEDGYIISEQEILLWPDDLAPLEKNEIKRIVSAYDAPIPQYEPFADGTVVDIPAGSLVDEEAMGADGQIIITTRRIPKSLYGIVDRPNTATSGTTLTVARPAQTLYKDGQWFVYNLATRVKATLKSTEKLIARRRKRGPEYHVFIPDMKGFMVFDRSQLTRHVFDRALFDRVVLSEEMRDKLLRLAPPSEQVSKKLRTWGVGTDLLQERSNIAMLMGPLGTGKTLTAKALAEYLKMPFYRVDSADLVHGLENALRVVAERAERWRALVLWDEAEIFLEHRLPMVGGSNPATSIVLQYIESFGSGILLIATNRPSVIDEGINSRIPVKFAFPPPDKVKRMQIWKAHIPETLLIEPSLKEQNGHWLSELADIPLDGRQIRNAVYLAARRAAEFWDRVPFIMLINAAKQIQKDAQAMSELRTDKWDKRPAHPIGFNTEPPAKS